MDVRAEVRPDGLHFDGPSGTFVGAWILDQALLPLATQGGATTTAPRK